MFRSDSDAISFVTLLVKRLKLRVPDPDFIVTRRYSPQWRCLGSVLYYKLPSSAGNLVVARRDARGEWKLSAAGLSDPGGAA